MSFDRIKPDPDGDAIYRSIDIDVTRTDLGFFFPFFLHIILIFRRSLYMSESITDV